VQYLARRDAGANEPFERWAADQGALAAELRALHARWLAFEPELARLTGARSPAEERAAELLRRLAGRAPGGARFEPRGAVGRGGMGEVERVFDPELGRELALKRAREDDADPAAERRRTARFLAEARITGGLQHPGIVPIHELGLDAAGRVYYTMPLIEGEDLERLYERVQAGEPGWTVPRVLACLLRVCETMAYAHARGVVHGDLKPANVRVGRFGEVYVMDWGLARLREAADERGGNGEPDGVEPVRAGAGLQASRVLGTPAYLAPEEVAGPRGAPDPRADVYALGAMLYRLLTGRLPHEDELRTARDLAEVRAALARPLAPLARGARGVAPELQSICERALAPLAQRYADVQALADDLRAYLEGRVVRAHATGPLVELKKWVGRNRAFAGALLALVVSLLLGLLASQTLFHRARAERDRVLRLSDVKRLAELGTRAEELWPAVPERVADCDAWLTEARALAARLPTHRATLAQLRTGARPEPEGNFAFSGTEAQWEHDTLAALVDELARFAEPEGGQLADVERRRAFASTVAERTLSSDEARARWAEARRALTAAPVYRGLALEPQLGLVPLGPDPRSGLLEFAQLASGTLPARGADGSLVLEESSAIVLVLLPGASFLMGAQGEDPALPNHAAGAFANEAPPHEVALAPFFLSKYELTQGQWLRAMGANPSTYGAAGDEPALLHPVETVSRGQCLALVRRLGLELPTEAQWEYAARAGTNTPWWTGADPVSLQGAANLADQAVVRAGGEWPQIERALDDGHFRHAPVTALRANPFGLHHVLGNVWEWCRDDFGGYELPARPGDGLRMLPAPGLPVGRGGGYVNNAAYARASLRDSRPDSPHLLFGLRPARALER
jgi:formylglycine-generating enzyme required for sulfatase activity/serine/threonine protein kinase